MAENFNLQRFVITIVIIGVVLILGIYISDRIGYVSKDFNTAGSVANETGYLNATGYTLAKSLTEYEFGSATIVAVLNATDNSTIGAGNYTLTNNALYNATETTWGSVRITYTYTYTAATDASEAADNVTEALATGTTWISILVVVGFATIILTMLTSGLGKAATAEAATPYY